MAGEAITADVWIANLGATAWTGFDERSAGRRLMAEVLPRYGLDPHPEPGEDDKPRCAGGGPAFNLSHSGSVVALAISPDSAVEQLGLDVEVLRPIPRAGAFARRILGEGERTADYGDGGEGPEQALTAAWCAKEAVLKAAGVGLRADPRTVTFDWSDPSAPQLVRAPEPIGPNHRWTLAARVLGGGDPALLVVAARKRREYDQRTKSSQIQLNLVMICR